MLAAFHYIFYQTKVRTVFVMIGYDVYNTAVSALCVQLFLNTLEHYVQLFMFSDYTDGLQLWLLQLQSPEFSEALCHCASDLKDTILKIRRAGLSNSFRGITFEIIPKIQREREENWL